MNSAEAAALAYTDALFAHRFEEAAGFLYPGDVERLRLLILNTTSALAAFGEENRLLASLGMTVDSLADPQTFGALLLAGMTRRAQRVSQQVGILEQEILEVEESGDRAAITVRTRLIPSVDADPRLHEMLSGMGPRDRVHHLQRIGDRWYILMQEGLQDHVSRVRNEIHAFRDRAARDQVSASSPAPEVELESFRICGFRDAWHRTVIEPRFTAARDFTEGLAAVRFFTSWGFIDTSGKTVINPRFSDAGSFSEGFAAAAIPDEGGDNVWGYIDRTGEWRIEPRFTAASEFHEDRAAVRCDDLWGYVDTAGVLQIPPCFASASDFQDGVAEVEGMDGESGFIDIFGQEVEAPD